MTNCTFGKELGKEPVLSSAIHAQKVAALSGEVGIII
jgi:hypothetical protein